VVLNIHAREYPVGLEALGALIDNLGSGNDRFWPRHRWPALRLDGPLAPGAQGGHGPIRDLVEAYDPGRLIRFRFTGPEGLAGWHALEAESTEGGRSRLRHTVRADLRGGMRLQWPLALRWLHDALIEDAFDCAARALGQPVPDRPFPLHVRLLRRLRRRSR
jgi:hypothetical protein